MPSGYYIVYFYYHMYISYECHLDDDDSDDDDKCC